MGLQLILPRDAGPKYVCRVPTAGGPCGERFYAEDRHAFEHHVILCSKRHEDIVQAERPSSRVPILHDSSLWDPEYEEYMAAIGERMKREGRIEQRRSEH